MWTTKIVFSLSLSFSPFFVYKSDRSCLLARSFTLRNSLMSLVSLSLQSIFFWQRREKEKIYIYKYIYTHTHTYRDQKGKRKIRTESNQIRWIQSVSFFFEIHRKNHLRFSFCSFNDKHLLIDDDGRFDMSSSWRRKKDNVPQNKWSSIVVDVLLSPSLSLSRSTTTSTQFRKYVVRRWASRPLNSITILMNNDEHRVGIREPIRTIEIKTVSTNFQDISRQRQKLEILLSINICK